MRSQRVYPYMTRTSPPFPSREPTGIALLEALQSPEIHCGAFRTVRSHFTHSECRLYK
jgi:hypothetical protein